MTLSVYMVGFDAVSLGSAAVIVLGVMDGWREAVFVAITFRDVGGELEIGLLPLVDSDGDVGILELEVCVFIFI